MTDEKIHFLLALSNQDRELQKEVAPSPLATGNWQLAMAERGKLHTSTPCDGLCCQTAQEANESSPSLANTSRNQFIYIYLILVVVIYVNLVTQCVCGDEICCPS